MEMQSRVEGVQCSNDMGAQGCSQCKGLRHPSLRDRMGAEINQGIHFNEEEFDASKMSKRERERVSREDMVEAKRSHSRSACWSVQMLIVHVLPGDLQRLAFQVHQPSVHGKRSESQDSWRCVETK